MTFAPLTHRVVQQNLHVVSDSSAAPGASTGRQWSMSECQGRSHHKGENAQRTRTNNLVGGKRLRDQASCGLAEIQWGYKMRAVKLQSANTRHSTCRANKAPQKRFVLYGHSITSPTSGPQRMWPCTLYARPPDEVQRNNIAFNGRM